MKVPKYHFKGITQKQADALKAHGRKKTAQHLAKDQKPWLTKYLNSKENGTDT